MKLSGNKRNGRYAASNQRNVPSQPNRNQEEQYIGPRAAKAAAKRKKKKRARRTLTVILIIIIALAAVLYCVYKLGVKPPPVKDRPSTPKTSDAAPEAEGTAPVSSTTGRKDNQFTFLIVGVSGGNTDTMMVANFDAEAYKLNVVSIPRDTLVNVAWNTKKANSLYPNNGIDGLLDGVSDLLGFPVDYYIEIELAAFVDIVDAVDGVNFDVPVDMKYDDPAQDLHINLNKGMQLLDGEHAIQLVRCRSVYSTADIGRIETQQAFLKAAAEQILQKKDKIDLPEVVNIVMNDVKTDLTAGYLIWLGQHFYKTDPQNITLSTIPANYWDTVNKTSYVTIYVDEWLEVINSQLNPYNDDITDDDLSILTRDSKGNLYVTDGVWAGKKSWGTTSSSSASTPSASPKPSVSPSPSPSSSPSPSPSSSDLRPSPSAEDISPDVSPTETVSDVSPSPSVSISPTPSTNANP